MAELQNQQKRQTALKSRIKDLVEGDYIVKDGWTPNYVVTPGNEEISRANIMAVVISKPENTGGSYESIIVDDGSGRMSIRAFEQGFFNDFFVGDAVQVIGRPRAYGREIYLVPEIVKKIGDKKWIEVRKIELAHKQPIIQPTQIKENIPEKKIDFKKKEEFVEEEKIEDESDSSFEKTIKLIKDLDSGEGVDVEEIVKKINSDDAEQIISSLLKQGEIFEMRPGKVKVLE